MPHRLHKLLAPVVVDLGYELWHVESLGSGKNAVLRLYIDSPGGIDIDDCEKVSREVSAVLDVSDDGGCAYQLEVSSPGIDRPLATPEHFERFIGQRARINMFTPISGQRKFNGMINAVKDRVVELACDDAIIDLSLDDMAKARLEPVFEDER